MPIELFFNLYVSPSVGDIFQLYGFHISRRCIESMDFYSCFSFPSFPQDKKGGGNYHLLYSNSIRKYQDDLKH